MSFSFNTPTPVAPLIPSSVNFSSAQIAALKTSKIYGNYSPWKEPCRATTTTDTTLLGLQTIDGILLKEGDRVLVRLQTIGSQNGIYEARSTGWPRTDDLTIGSSAAGTATLVMEGLTGEDITFICTNDVGTDVVGSDDLVFSLMSGGGGVPAGGSDTDVQYNSGGLLSGSDNFTYDGTTVNLQVPLTLTTTTNTNVVSIQAVAANDLDYGLILPTDVGTAGQFLSTDGGLGASSPLAELSWATGGGGGSGSSSLPVTSVQFASDGIGGFGGSSNFKFTETGLIVGSGQITLGEEYTGASPVGVTGISAADATTANAGGGYILLRAGIGDGSGDGGEMKILGGSSDITSGTGNGGITRIEGGSGGTTSGNGGDLTFDGGSSSTLGNGGNIDMVAGASDTLGNGGSVLISSGSAGSTSGNAGSMNLSTNGGSGDGDGGALTIIAGNAGNTSGNTSGTVSINGGNSNATANTVGGNITLNAGSSGGGSGVEGGVFITVIKSGATQGAAGAAANELWKTSSHATLPNNVVMIGV
jgi:hypothetical protein